MRLAVVLDRKRNADHNHINDYDVKGVLMDRFIDKVALVTGAGSGIGAAVARRVASEGGRVACLDLDGVRARAVVAEIDASGGRALAVTADVADDRAVAAAVAEVFDWSSGELDVLANVAGVGFYRSLEDTTVAEFERLLGVNLLAPFRLVKLCADQLRARSGAIVNVASAAGLNGRAYLSAYASTKGGLVALTRSLAVELAPDVRVNAVCPGGVDTPLLEQFRVPDDVDHTILARHPALIGRRSTADEIAASIAHLAADEAASTTGSVLLVDGGCAA